MIRLRAPAKLNLYLRVLGQRPDGYHEIETLFERIDLTDELTFDSARDVSLTCTDPMLSCGEDNLIIRAARALQQLTGTTTGARIHLTKRIPIAAGLGGGSSDAAATLLGLNDLWDLRFHRGQLVALAAGLGSDVPFFLADAAFAIGRGRGERCESVATSRSLAHVLVVPDAHLSTKAVYEGAQFNLTAREPSITMVAHALTNGSLGELATGLWNDLQPEAIRRCPALPALLAQLRDRGCLGVSLSGSGPSVFGLCRDVPHAHTVAARLRSASAGPWRIDVIHTDHPPLKIFDAYEAERARERSPDAGTVDETG